jgi:F-type H+-transporting ATPase subunit b
MNLITPDFGIIFWQTVTLLFVIFILGKFAWKPILGIIEQREKRIAGDLDAAQDARKMIAELRHQQKQLIEAANAQREQIIREAENAKSVILEEAGLEAKQLSDRMLEQARLIITEEKEAAFAQLKGEIAKLSVEIAEKLLRKELQSQDKQEELIRKLIEKRSLN